MRIMIIANSSGGLYNFRKDLINELKKNNEIIIVTPFSNQIDKLKALNIKLIEIPIDRRGINPLTDLKLLNSYRKLFNKIKPDLAITYTIKPNIYASLIARFKKIDYAVNITGLGTTFQSDNLLRKLIVFLYKIALKKVKVVFFENEENQNIFINEHIVSRDKTCKLNGAGVNLEDYPLMEYPDENQDIRFLFIGRIMKEKGIDELLEAAGRIKKDYPAVQFDIVGPMEDNYKETIDEYVNNDVINYYGFQSDVKPFIKQCHCFILPSYHEGMANTLLESASMGRPLITSNMSGCKEAINNNGYLVKVKDSNDLYFKIKEFIELDYQDKVILSKNSRKHIEEVFDKRKVVKKTIKFLDND